MDDNFLHELMEDAGRELRAIRVVKKETAQLPGKYPEAELFVGL